MLKFKQECADTLIKIESVTFDLERVLTKTSLNLDDSIQVSNLYKKRKGLIDHMINFKKKFPNEEISSEYQSKIDSIIEKDKNLIDRLSFIKKDLSKKLITKSEQKKLFIYTKEF